MPFKKGEKAKGSKPFKKGQSGNPKGRPEGVRNRATVINEMLEKMTKVSDPSDPTNRLELSLYEAMVLGQIKSAMEGNTRAFQEIQDTLYGKMTDKVQIDVNKLDSDIERELALITAGSEAGSAREAEESIH